MSHWGYVIEQLTHDDERQRTERAHRRKRREARRLDRLARSQDQPPTKPSATATATVLTPKHSRG